MHGWCSQLRVFARDMSRQLWPCGQSQATARMYTRNREARSPRLVSALRKFHRAEGRRDRDPYMHAVLSGTVALDKDCAIARRVATSIDVDRGSRGSNRFARARIRNARGTAQVGRPHSTMPCYVAPISGYQAGRWECHNAPGSSPRQARARWRCARHAWQHNASASRSARVEQPELDTWSYDRSTQIGLVRWCACPGHTAAFHCGRAARGRAELRPSKLVQLGGQLEQNLLGAARNSRAAHVAVDALHDLALQSRTRRERPAR
jgi:hypothetical protein